MSVADLDVRAEGDLAIGLGTVSGQDFPTAFLPYEVKLAALLREARVCLGLKHRSDWQCGLGP